MIYKPFATSFVVYLIIPFLGVIKVDGTSATGSGAGGGSGGTIVAYCRNLLGDGTLSVNGGQGSGKGGGGSGGRMKFIFTQR